MAVVSKKCPDAAFSPALQNTGVRARRPTAHHITHSRGTTNGGASAANHHHVHTENKLSLAADGDFRVPVRLPDHKQHTDVSLYVSVEPCRANKKPRHSRFQTPGRKLKR